MTKIVKKTPEEIEEKQRDIFYLASESKDLVSKSDMLYGYCMSAKVEILEYRGGENKGLVGKLFKGKIRIEHSEIENPERIEIPFGKYRLAKTLYFGTKHHEHILEPTDLPEGLYRKNDSEDVSVVVY